MPSKRFQGIKIEIEAPDREDLGSLLSAWTKVRDLIQFLAQVDELLNIDIYLLETGPSLSTFVKSQKSTSLDIEDPDEVWHDFDFKAILMPFFQLRNVRKVCIYCLPGLVPGDIVPGNTIRVMK
jgi:hypothetical protein